MYKTTARNEGFCLWEHPFLANKLIYFVKHVRKSEQFYCISGHIRLSGATLLPIGIIERKIEIFRTKNATRKNKTKKMPPIALVRAPI